MKLLEKMALIYANGGWSQHMKEFTVCSGEERAFVAGFKAAREMAWDFVKGQDEFTIKDMGEEEV